MGFSLTRRFSCRKNPLRKEVEGLLRRLSATTRAIEAHGGPGMKKVFAADYHPAAQRPDRNIMSGMAIEIGREMNRDWILSC